MKHTEGDLKLAKRGERETKQLPILLNGKAIAAITEGGLDEAKRIIATYNACRGLSDEDLKLVKHAPAMLAALKEI
ncbi:MAG: hypothetical protein ACYST3_07205, partial [Planctomycetota bacterium]